MKIFEVFFRDKNDVYMIYMYFFRDHIKVTDAAQNNQIINQSARRFCHLRE